jgi:hypothetical protein
VKHNELLLELVATIEFGQNESDEMAVRVFGGGTCTMLRSTNSQSSECEINWREL